MTHRMRYAFTIFALLDLVSFLHSFQFLETLLIGEASLDFLRAMELCLIVSFLASSVLFMWRKKKGLLIYFFQLPLRILFMLLSFGFLFDVFGLLVGTAAYLIVLGLVFLLELLRLTYSVFLYGKL